MTTSPSEGTNLAQLKELARSGNESRRIGLARDPQTPDEILQILVADRSMLVRDFALTEARRRGLPPATPATATSSSAGGGARGGRSVTEAASQALSSARLLYTANFTILVFSLIGALILVILGFQSTCPDGSSYCYESDKQSNPALAIMGVAVALSAFWIFAIANAIAARVELAGAQAESRS